MNKAHSPKGDLVALVAGLDSGRRRTSQSSLLCVGGGKLSGDFASGDGLLLVAFY
jgi:hypothetical protein